jgi:2-keto-4-pentenoate hydratase/2-oxohepta-3-ene-1,7-dioic acid hydratase in catechol pathway
MKRREFITVAAAGSASLPALAAAQSTAPAQVMPQGTQTRPAAPGAEAPTALPRTQRTGPASPATGLIVANLRGRTGAGTGKDNTDVRLAVRVESGLLDVTVAARALGFSVPQTTDELIENGEGQLRACMAKAMAAPRADWLVAENAAAFAPCVSNPQKIVCIGLNYRRHAREIGMAEPKAPILFNKFNNALTHHRATVPTQGLPGNHFDYECELVIVMGRRCVGVPEEHALEYVYGYCTGNDFSERSSQLITSQWMAGKSSDGFAPLGPYLVSADLVGNPNALKLETHVNGEVRQSSNTEDLIFNCHQLISYCSHLFPLEPGDIIFTGTPEGVVLGMPKERQVWLKTGDRVVTTIEKLGSLEITVG